MPICKLTFVEKIEKGVERYDCSLCVGFTTRNNASRERQDHADAHGAELEYEKRPTRVKLETGSEYQAVLPAASKRSAADCTDLPSKSQAVALLPSKKAELERTIADLREEIKSHTEKSTTLATHQSELKVQNEQLADRCQGLQIQVEQMTRQIEQLRVVEKRAAELKGLLDSTRVDLARASGELSNLDGTDGLQKGVKKIMLRYHPDKASGTISKAEFGRQLSDLVRQTDGLRGAISRISTAHIGAPGVMDKENAYKLLSEAFNSVK